jgi:hypothetical protein
MSEETKKIETRGDILYRLMVSQKHAASTFAAIINNPGLDIEKIRDLRSNVKPVGDAHIDIFAEALQLTPEQIADWKKAPRTREEAPAQPHIVLTDADMGVEAVAAPAAAPIVAADAQPAAGDASAIKQKLGTLLKEHRVAAGFKTTTDLADALVKAGMKRDRLALKRQLVEIEKGALPVPETDLFVQVLTLEGDKAQEFRDAAAAAQSVFDEEKSHRAAEAAKKAANDAAFRRRGA